jgi:hypothetical protein
MNNAIILTFFLQKNDYLIKVLFKCIDGVIFDRKNFWNMVKGPGNLLK